MLARRAGRNNLNALQQDKTLSNYRGDDRQHGADSHQY